MLNVQNRAEVQLDTLVLVPIQRVDRSKLVPGAMDVAPLTTNKPMRTTLDKMAILRMATASIARTPVRGANECSNRTEATDARATTFWFHGLHCYPTAACTLVAKMIAVEGVPGRSRARAAKILLAKLKGVGNARARYTFSPPLTG